MKKLIRFLTIALTVFLLLGTMVGCSQKESSTATSGTSSAATTASGSKETTRAASGSTSGYAFEAKKDPVTLTIFVDGAGTLWESWGNDPVSRKITELTGISFKCIAPVSSDDSKLTLLIASDDLPDVVTAWYGNTAWSSMVQNKMLADVEALANQYAPKLRSELVDEEIWNYCRADDGKVYYLLNSYRTKEALKWFEDNDYLIATNQPVILMRQDYYEEIGKPDIKSAADFMKACEQIKNNHPDTIPFYTGGLTTAGPSYLRYFFGVGIYHIAQDGTVSMSYRNPKYVDMYVWVNEMVRKGLMTEDSFVDGSEEKDSKSLAGAVASYAWTIGESEKTPANNPNTYYYPMKPWDSYEQVRTNAGYIQFAISEKSKNKEAAIRWFEFGNTELGARTMCWGIEGKKEDGWSGDVVNGPHFYFDEKGKATYYEGFQAARNADWSGVERKSGLGFFQSYICTNSVYITEAEVIKSELMTQMNAWYRDKVSYNNGFIFNIPAGSDEYVTYQTINSLIEEYNVKWAYAKDEQEVRRLYDEFIKKVEASGEAKLNEWYTKTYKENMKKYQ